MASRDESVIGLSDLRYAHVVSYALSTPWAILPEVLSKIMSILALRASGGRFSAEEIARNIGAVTRATTRTVNTIAVLPLQGVIVHRAGMMADVSGAVSVEAFRASFRAAMADPSIAAIVLDVDSPGGSVDGVPEMAAEILAARGSKPVYAVANTLAASAAYWLAASADELWASPSAMVGSIGVFAAHEDMSKAREIAGVTTTLISAGKYKTDGNPYEPLGEEAKAAVQETVDHYYDLFVKAVAKARRVDVSAVRDGYGEGRVVPAKKAMSLGMVDGIGTLEDVIGQVDRKLRKGRGMRAEDRRRLLLT